MSTIDQIFKNLGLVEWWNQPITQNFGTAGEKGADFGMGGMGKPIGSLTSGTVVYVGNGGYGGSSIGQIVQVKTPNGALLHYQHLKDSTVSVGQSVSPGNTLGHGGGCPVGAYYNDPTRNDCKSYDSFSTGQHIEVRYSSSYNPSGGVWSQNWISPSQIFRQLGGGSGTYVPLASTGTNIPLTGISIPGLDLTGIQQSINIFFERAALFMLALLFVGFGFYIAFQKQIDAGVGQAVKLAEVAAV